jgi:hypothetical protein
MALRELLLSLGVEVDKSGVSNANNALGKLKKAALVAAAAFAAIKAVKGIASLVDDVRGIGDELDKTSKQLGVSTDALQEWRHAAGLAGVSGKSVSVTMRKLQKNAFEAAKGNKMLEEDFAKLGVSVEDSNGNLKTADQLMQDMGDGFAKLTNASEKSALAQNLMGRSGAELIPLFNEGSEAIGKMRQEAHDLGSVMSEKLIKQSVVLTDQQARASAAWQGVKNQIASFVMPIFIALANTMIKVAKAIQGPLKVAIGAIKFVLEVLGNIISFIVDGWKMLIDVLGTVGTSFLALGAAIAIFGKAAILTAGKVALAWIVANLPFILMAVLIGLMLLALEDFIGFLQGKDSLIGRFIGGFTKWVDQMGGISGAIGAIMEKLFKDIFGLSDDTSRKIGAVFFAVGEVFRWIFGTMPEAVGEALAAAYLWVVDFVADFRQAISDAIDWVVGKFEALTDAVADAIGVVADFVGLGEDPSIKANLKHMDELSAASKKAREDEKALRLAVLTQLEKEGVGTIKKTAETKTHTASVGLTGVKDQAAGERRFKEVEALIKAGQTVNAPITVKVDASGATNPAMVASKTAAAIDASSTQRRAKQGLVTGS